MKKTYETPSIEVVKFQYRDQVVAASAACTVTSHYDGTSVCQGTPTPNGGMIDEEILRNPDGGEDLLQLS